MVYMKNTETGQYIQAITGEAITWTNAKIDAFDFDKDPTAEEKATFQGWITGTGLDAPVDFVAE